VIDIDQTNNDPSFALFEVQNDQQVRLFNGDCTEPMVGYSTGFDGGQAYITIDGASTGQMFIVSVKYETGAVVGQPIDDPNSPPTIHYDFSTLINGSVIGRDLDGLDLKPR
jgi:hypothetical protein